MHRLIITAAITGSGPPRSQTPHHPVTADAIAREAHDAWRAGAAIVHCHARREDGTPTNDPVVYADLLARIRVLGCEAIINFSGGDNGGRSNHAERLGVIVTGAEIVSLGGGSFNLGERLYDNSPSFRQQMALTMRASGVTPELEIFDVGQLAGIDWLRGKGLLPTRPLVTLVFGIPGALPLDLALLHWLAERMPADAHWSVSCQTRDYHTFRQFMLVTFALGGHIRTGMEDCVWLRPDELAESNAMMVKQWVDMARMWGRSVATAEEARAMLGIRTYEKAAIAA